jgi:WhiB family redox-sensing transcriptional regulator
MILTMRITSRVDRPQESVLLGTWQDEANCLGTDPDLFYPERGATPDAAKAVCKGCVVRSECLYHALKVGEHHGIWGGLTAAERRRLRQGRLHLRTVPS